MKRWFAIFAVVALLTLLTLGVAYRLGEPGRQSERFAGIQPGMSKAEVIAIMGAPTGPTVGAREAILLGVDLRDLDRMLYWPVSRDESSNYVVIFNEKGDVVDKRKVTGK
jgi:hypothetical protein